MKPARFAAAALVVAAGLGVVAVAVHLGSSSRRRRPVRAGPEFRPSTFALAPDVGVVTAARPSAGCAGPARSLPGGEATRLGDRSYLAWGPAGGDPQRAYPLVVVLHGWHSTAADFARWFTMESYVDDAAFVMYPEAAPGSSGTWDIGGTRDLDAIDAMIDDLAARSCIDRARILVFGFSYGGKLAHHLGCARPDRIKAIAVGDGSMGRPEVGCGTIPVLVTHRTHDDDELFAWGRDAVLVWKAGAGCSDESDVVDPVHDCRTFRGCRAPVTFCEDSYVNASWPDSWNHTVREEYRALTWKWFQSLP